MNTWKIPSWLSCYDPTGTRFSLMDSWTKTREDFKDLRQDPVEDGYEIGFFQDPFRISETVSRIVVRMPLEFHKDLIIIPMWWYLSGFPPPLSSFLPFNPAGFLREKTEGGGGGNLIEILSEDPCELIPEILLRFWSDCPCRIALAPGTGCRRMRFPSWRYFLECGIHLLSDWFISQFRFVAGIWERSAHAWRIRRRPSRPAGATGEAATQQTGWAAATTGAAGARTHRLRSQFGQYPAAGSRPITPIGSTAGASARSEPPARPRGDPIHPSIHPSVRPSVRPPIELTSAGFLPFFFSIHFFPSIINFIFDVILILLLSLSLIMSVAGQGCLTLLHSPRCGISHALLTQLFLISFKNIPTSPSSEILATSSNLTW